MRTLQDFDDAIEVIEKPTDSDEINDLMVSMGLIFRGFRKGQLNLINELLAMYDSASEHNVDIGRTAIFQLAQRLAGVDRDRLSVFWREDLPANEDSE